MKPSGPGLLLDGRFLITVSISVLVMGLLRFSISSCSVLESCTFLRICPFLPRCPFYWHVIADSSLMILCISVLSVVISPFSFLTLLIWFFSLCFFMSLANGLLILFILSKNPLLAFLIFSMVSFVSFAFISALIFKIYFHLLTLGFSISSFSSCFRCRVRLFIWLFFLISWGMSVLLWTFPLALLL